MEKGLDYREIGDKFGIGASTACMKVNEAMKLLVSSKMHIISKLQRGIYFQRIINGFQRKWNFPVFGCHRRYPYTHKRIPLQGRRMQCRDKITNLNKKYKNVKDKKVRLPGKEAKKSKDSPSLRI